MKARRHTGPSAPGGVPCPAPGLCDLRTGHGWFPAEGVVLKRGVVLVGLAAAMLVAGCGASGSGSPAATGQSSAAPGASASTGPSADLSAQFGGNVCTALTRAEIEAATYPQGPATFASTDTQKDATTGKPVVCQYLVIFDGKPSIVGAAVSVMDDTEFATRTATSLIAPPEPLPGIGTEAYVVLPAPGLVEVWVTGPHGHFKVGAQARETAIAFATLAAGRD